MTLSPSRLVPCPRRGRRRGVHSRPGRAQHERLAGLQRRGRPVDYLATAGLVWVIVLAVSALLVSRTVRDLDRRVTTQDAHLAATAGPRRGCRGSRTAPSGCWPTRQPAGRAAADRGPRDRRVGGVEALARFPDNRPPDQWFTEAPRPASGSRWSGWPSSARWSRCRSCRRASPLGERLAVHGARPRPGRAVEASGARGTGWSRRSPSMRRSRATRRSGRPCCRTGSAG